MKSQKLLLILQENVWIFILSGNISLKKGELRGNVRESNVGKSKFRNREESASTSRRRQCRKIF